jgi:UDP-N-acetylmuramoyl-tripeptide--D-alanyl-D-alanine ligase
VRPICYQAGSKIDFLLGVRGLGEADGGSGARSRDESGIRRDARRSGEWLARETREGDVVLLKASRGVKLEKALETWQEKSGIPNAPGQGN